MGQLSRRGVAASDDALQSGAVVLGQDYGVLSLPEHAQRPPIVRCHAATQKSECRHDAREGVLLQTNYVSTLGRV